MENDVISCMEFSIVSSESYFSKSLCSLTEINDSIFFESFLTFSTLLPYSQTFSKILKT